MRFCGIIKISPAAQSSSRILHFQEALAMRMQIDHVLQGHTGCVNRLAWNQEGTRLASVSDDRQVLLWPYQEHEHLPPIHLDTAHQSNIFGVALLPHCNDTKVVTGAMDSLVQLHTLDSCFPSRQQLNRNRARARLHPDSTIATAPATTQTFACHRCRVKDVEVQVHNPNMFWSASEDGMVRQFDTRTSDQGRFESPNVLLGVRGRTRAIQLKAVSINKARPYQMAVACGDPFIRIYDMRKLSTQSPGNGIYSTPLLQLAPPHMQSRASSLEGEASSTHVAFSARGDKVLTTYHGDHAYCFDITGEAKAYSNVYLRHNHNAKPLSSGMEKWKFNGNAALFEKDFYSAIRHYTRGLQCSPNSTALLISRASAYMQRQWEGDAAFALLDCEAALAINPDLPRAYLLQAQALLALRRLRLATQAAKTLAARYPGQHKDEVSRLRENLLEEIGITKKSKAQRKVMKQRRRAQREAARDRARRQEGTQLGTAYSDEEFSSEDEEFNRQALENFPPQDSSVDPNDERWNLFLNSDRSFMLSPALYSDESEAEHSDDSFIDQIHPSTPRSWQASCTGCENDTIPSVWDKTEGSRRLMNRYVGHCNVQTDIKEAVFLGQNDSLVACGSDDGRVYLYHAESGTPLRALNADEDVVNCIQSHPVQAMLATSGIEMVVKIWTPGSNPEGGDVDRMIRLNQSRMKDGPQWYSRGVFQNAMRAHVLQTLSENPELIPELRSLLVTQSGRRQAPPVAANNTNTTSAAGDVSPRVATPVPQAAAGPSLLPAALRDLSQTQAPQLAAADIDDAMIDDDSETDFDYQQNPYTNCRMT